MKDCDRCGVCDRCGTVINPSLCVDCQIDTMRQALSSIVEWWESPTFPDERKAQMMANAARAAIAKANNGRK